MTKKIYFMAILFAFLMQSMSVWSNTNGISPVSMYRKHAPKLDGNPKPSKAPANFNIPLAVFLDEDSQQLIVTPLADGDYTYNIYDGCGSVVTQRLIKCTANDSFSIDLCLCQSGFFTVEFVVEGNAFEGEFEIEE